MKRLFLQFGGNPGVASLLICFFLFSSSIKADDTTDNGDFLYTAISPSELRPFSTYSIVTTLEKAKSPVKFHFSIYSGENDTLVVSTEESLEPEEQKLITLDIPALEKSQYNLSVRVIQVDGGKEISEERTVLDRQYRNSTILIQTDKPIYKPSETVKFRVFLLSRDFQPFKASRKVDITLRDPQSNIIKSWKAKEIPANRGFISESVELSSEPNLGDWTIQVDFDEGKLMEQKSVVEQSPALKASSSPNSISNQRFRPRPPSRREEIPLLTETFSFSVDQYVLPKYKVDVKLSPTFITYNSSVITAEVSATYTFGKPVAGKCTLVLNNPNIYSYRPRDEQSSKIRQVSRSLHLEEGKGRAFVEFDVTKDLNVLPDEVTTYGRDYKIDISCIDSVSSKVRNTSSSFRMFKLPYKADLIEGSQQDLKPGLPYFVKVRVTFQDGRPVEDSDPMALKIEHMFNLSVENSVLYSSLDKLGESSTTFQVPTNPRLCYNEGIQVTYKDLSQTLYLGRKIVSSTGNYLSLSAPRSSPEEGASVTLDLYKSKPYSRVNLLAISKGKIVYNDLVKFEDPDNLNHQLSFNLPHGSSPSVKVIVYTVAPGSNDVVADFTEFDVRQSGKVELNLSLSDESAEPGTNVTLKVKGLPNSIFGLRAVDTSVLILKKDNDLSQEKLNSAAQRFNPHTNYWGGGYVYQQISRAGLDLLTNAVVEKPTRPQYEIESHYSLNKVSMMDSAGFGGAPPPMAFAAAPVRISGSSGGGNGGAAPRVRSNFVETWIWEDFESPDGETTLTKTVPDTITSWSISAFQLNAEEGLGLSASPSKLTVFRPFFVALNLPYSIVKGEVLGLQVLLHNYLEVPTETQVTLENDNGFFKFLEKDGEDVSSLSKTIKLNASSVSSVTFPISAVKFGTGNLRVKAVSDAAGDAVTVPLIVRPPGIKHTQNNAVFLNLLDESKSPVTQQVSPIFPENRVEGADSVRVSVIGDILGGTMSNLQRLIQLPSGCGEQNMLHFVPDVVILEYLNVTGGLTPEIQERTLRYLSSGYQRQLTFLRYDGSFSAFGKSDNVGSTWLTAFVTRWFIRAKTYIPIDNNVIYRSLKFLVNQQNDNGSFAEEGRVYDKSLQGGSGSNQYSLTAFVLLTFHAAQKAGIDLKKAIEGTNFTSEGVIANGTSFILNGTSEGQLKDPYGNALISYLFTELNHPEAERYYKLTDEAAKIDLKSGLKHWEALKPRRRPVDENTSGKFPEVFLRQPWEPKIKPSSVETTAYALLTSVLRGNLSDDTFSIARWLLKQRNAQGGFISTQDTVVGISALASFAAALQTQQNSKADMKVDVKVNAQAEPAHSFDIRTDSLTTLQEFILPLNESSDKEVALVASGKGTALAQLTWSYYIEVEDSSPSFAINIDVQSKDKGRMYNLRVCSSVLRGDDSNMAILELTAPSGYVFDDEELETLRIEKKAFRRYETEDRDSRVSLYFDSVSSRDHCVSLNVYRVFLVAQQANATAVLYDYYDTTRRAQQFYSIPQVSLCDLCANDGTCKLNNCA